MGRCLCMERYPFPSYEAVVLSHRTLDRIGCGVCVPRQSRYEDWLMRCIPPLRDNASWWRSHLYCYALSGSGTSGDRAWQLALQ
jgi:hypothetical protein